MCIKSAGGVGKKVGGGYVHRWPLYTEGYVYKMYDNDLL